MKERRCRIVSVCQIEIKWDPESFVWAAASRDLAGLVLEDPSLDRLTERVRLYAPALLARSGRDPQTELVFQYDGPNCR